MKKKISILAVLVLTVVLSTGLTAGTYAKYTSGKETSDSARVAKWGIGVDNTVELFKDSYIGTEGGTDVVAADGTKVIAPGTSGEYTFELTGAPETNYTLAVKVTGEDKTGKLVFTLDGTKVGTNGTIAELQTAIENIYNTGKVYAANTTSASKHVIGWYWTFSEDEATDATDTALGNGEGDSDLTADAEAVKLTVSITATQTEKDATA